jgi:hypothetical protein
LRGDTSGGDVVAKGFALRHGAGMSRAYKLACGCTVDSKTALVKVRSAARRSIFTALSLVIGAFMACLAAALGGRQQRDLHP